MRISVEMFEVFSGRRKPGRFTPLFSFVTRTAGCRTDRGHTTLFQGQVHLCRMGPIEIFSSSSFERSGIQLHRTPTLDGALRVFLWACSARGSGDGFQRFSNRCCCPPLRLRSHMLSDFISSPHSPFKSLIRLLLRHIVVGQLTYIAPCRHLKPVAPGAQLAHGTEQRTQSGGQERWTDPTVETSMRPVAGPLCAPSCACLVGARAWRGISSSRPSRRQVDTRNPCSAGALRPTGQY